MWPFKRKKSSVEHAMALYFTVVDHEMRQVGFSPSSTKVTALEMAVAYLEAEESLKEKYQ